MTKLEKAKKIIKKYYKDGDCGIYDSRNIVGDWMTNIYNDGELSKISTCAKIAHVQKEGDRDITRNYHK